MVGFAIGPDGVYTWLGLVLVDDTDLTAFPGSHIVERLVTLSRWAPCYSHTWAQWIKDSNQCLWPTQSPDSKSGTFLTLLIVSISPGFLCWRQ